MPRLVPPTDEAIAQAARLLREGQIVAFTTETVYGLGADTLNVSAIERVYQLKGRPAYNPLIAHVLDPAQARQVVGQWTERCQRLAERFWPGPLTIVLPRGALVPPAATAGWSTIAVRAPAHPLARRLLGAFGSSISAPSANRWGFVSPTTARHVAEDFADVDDLVILDGGPCEIGIESTVVDLCGAVARVLRPGAVAIEHLRRVLGKVEALQITTQAASPGTWARHYAPHTPAELVDGASLRSRLDALGAPVVVLCFDADVVAAPHCSIVMPGSAKVYAARLYDALRQADAMHLERIIIETPPQTQGIWPAIHDRLQRATQGNEEQ